MDGFAAMHADYLAFACGMEQLRRGVGQFGAIGYTNGGQYVEEGIAAALGIVKFVDDDHFAVLHYAVASIELALFEAYSVAELFEEHFELFEGGFGELHGGKVSQVLTVFARFWISYCIQSTEDLTKSS